MYAQDSHAKPLLYGDFFYSRMNYVESGNKSNTYAYSNSLGIFQGPVLNYDKSLYLISLGHQIELEFYARKINLTLRLWTR